MSELDVQQFFSLSKDDISAVCERFRDDRRVAAAIQLLFLRASGRPMDRFAAVPKVLLRSVCEAFGLPSVSIASLRSLYERRQTLYEHQAWARTYLGLSDVDEVQFQKMEQVLAVAALEAAHPDDLMRTAAPGCTAGESSFRVHAELGTGPARRSTPRRRQWPQRTLCGSIERSAEWH
nr:DUF4158 domain-containing protein [Variovorax sp. dw_308]